MKAGILAVAAALAAGVSAEGHIGRRHAHDAFHKRDVYASSSAAAVSTAAYATSSAAAVSTSGYATSSAAAVYGTSSAAPIHTSSSTCTGSSAVSSAAAYHASSVVSSAAYHAPSSFTTSCTSSSKWVSSAAAYQPYQPSSVSIAAPVAPTCSCTTIYTTYYGEVTLVHPTSTIAPVVVVPTPYATTVHSTGVYTFPATTVTLTKETTVCAATSTHVPSGTHTYGGVTTVVKSATTIVCPYATAVSSNGAVTSTLLTTTYVCPSAGTYTIAPTSTSVTCSTVLVYPTPATYAPGTYTKAATTTTITKTDYVVFCPYTSSAAPKPVTTAAYVAPSAYVAPKPVTTSKAPVASYAAPAPGKLGSSGNKWGITYTPYTEDAAGVCKDEATISADIALIASKGFKAIRVYSTDCGALEMIPKVCEAKGIKLILGIFIDNKGIAGAEEQVSAILAWAKWEQVDLVVIGNEALHAYPPRCSGPELADFIGSVKARLRAKGYNGPCTTAEPLNVWQENTAALCAVVDVVGLNIHPFFNADVDAAHAGEFAKGQLDIAAGLCYGKDAYNLETGWPSYADRCNGKACAGPAEQATAIHSIMEYIGGKSIMFSFGDDKWKQAGDFGCEQHWGSINLY